MAKPAPALQQHHDYKIEISQNGDAYSVNTPTLNVILHDHVKFKNNCAAAVYITFTLADETTQTEKIKHNQHYSVEAEVVGTVTYSLSANPPVGKVIPGDDPYVIIVGSSDSSARS
jgi:hypothetical protein